MSKQKSLLILFVLYFTIFIVANLLRFFLLEKVFAFLYVTTLSTLIFHVSSGSNAGSGGGESSLPAPSGQASPSSYTNSEDSFAIRVLLEPFSDSEIETEPIHLPEHPFF